MAKALAKAPADRYAHCLDFAAALREACGLRPEDASDPGGLAQPQPGSAGQPGRPRQPTEIATPAGPIAAAGAAAAAAAAAAGMAGPAAGGAGDPASAAAGSAAAQDQPASEDQPAREDRPGSEDRPGGPPTEAVRIPGTAGPARPGLTEPPSGAGGYGPPPGGDAAGYGPVPGFGPPGSRGAGDHGRPRRPWWRSRGVVAAAAAVVVLVLLGGGYLLIGGSGGGSGSTGGSQGGGTGGGVLKVPGCTTEMAAAKSLGSVTSSSVKLGGKPFAVKVTPDGKYSFVTLGNSLAVLTNGHGLAPTLVHTFSLPGASKGEAITKNGQYLLLATGSGAKVISVPEAEQGIASVVGTLSSPKGRGAVQVAVTPDSHFAFVTLQSSGGVAVFNLQQALATGFGPANFVGIIPTGVQPVGITESANQKWLYVTSIQKVATSVPSEGLLSVISVHKAEVKPARSVAATVAAGCSPVRVLASKSVIWVTARESDALLGFSVPKLQSDPAHALTARVAVGEGPIGLSFVAHGKRIVVADSDLKSISGATPGLSVVNTAKALAHQPALLGTVKSGVLPRQLYMRGKTLLVTDYGSGQLQAIKIADLP